MGLKHAALVFDTQTSGSSQRLCLLELAFHADRHGVIRMTQTELADVTGLNRRTVAACYTQLEEASILTRLGHGRYRLNETMLTDSDAVSDGTAPRHMPTRSQKAHAAAAAAELERIKALRGPDDYVAYTPDGWPLLKHGFSKLESEAIPDEDS